MRSGSRHPPSLTTGSEHACIDGNRVEGPTFFAKGLVGREVHEAFIQSERALERRSSTIERVLTNLVAASTSMQSQN